MSKAVKFTDFFGPRCFYFKNVLDVGIIARHTGTKELDWLCLDSSAPGPCVSIPVKEGAVDPVYYFHAKWPAN